MVIYSDHSHQKIVHLPSCSIIRRMEKNYRKSFETMEDARRHGYRLCNCCAQIASAFRKENEEINTFQNKTGMTIKFYDGAIHIISKQDCWRILKNKGHIILYHKNAGSYSNESCTVQGFHEQPVRMKTIMGYLRYIEQHDQYRETHPYWKERNKEAEPTQ